MSTKPADLTNQQAQLRLMQLVSPSLPIGSFTYSQGIEWAVEANWITNAETLAQWLRELIHSSLAKIDLPILMRHYQACQTNDLAALEYWNDQLLAYRETSELRLEEKNRGRALAQLLVSLNIANAKEWKAALSRSQSSGFALASAHWKIAINDMLTGYAWSWLENLALAGVKIIPLGQTAGQQLLNELVAELPLAIDTAIQLDDTEIGANNPALAIASANHETQYTRIFRS